MQPSFSDPPPHEASSHHRNRPRKQRASKACTACRERKVRCDVSRTGLPCSNCVSGHKHCLTTERNRRRAADRPVASDSSTDSMQPYPLQWRNVSFSSLTNEPATFTNSPPAFNALPMQQLDTIPEVEGLDAVYQTTPHFASPKSALMSSDHHCFQPGPSEGIQGVSPNFQNAPLDRIEDETCNSYEDIEGGSSCSSALPDKDLDSCSSFPSQLAECQIIFSYYDFLIPPPLSHLDIQDVQLLEQYKCFSVPVRPILDEIIRVYFLYVQPHFPLFDESSVWHVYMSSTHETPIRDRLSLFTFQALLCVASSFLDHPTLTQLGFNSPRQARNSWYRKAKTLFDVAIEKDDLSISQGALLLTYFTPKTDSTANSYWLSNAVEYARRIHAHEHHTRIDLSDKRRAQLKRLWWCCILRDTTLSLGLRRPLQISWIAVGTHSPLLDEQDFEDEINYSTVYDADTKRALVQLVSLFCELSVYLLEALELLYPRWGSSRVQLSREVRERRKRTLHKCQGKLKCWYSKASSTDLPVLDQSSYQKSVIVLKNLVYMMYHSANVAIYNDIIITAAIDAAQNEPALVTVDCHAAQLEQALTGITRCLIEILKANLISSFPVTLVAFAALPLVWYVVGSKLATTTRETSAVRDCVHIYTKSMKSCQSVYEGADAIVDNVGRLMNLIKLQSPPPFNSATNISKWSGILLSQPTVYASIVSTVDFVLASGHYPKFSDLPLALQLPEGAGMFSLCASISTRSLGQIDMAAHNTIARMSYPGNNNGGVYHPSAASSEDPRERNSGASGAKGPVHTSSRPAIPPAEQQVLQQLLQGYYEAGIAG